MQRTFDRVSSRRGSAVVLVNPTYTSQLERTERLRLGLLNQDSSCSPGQTRVPSTQSESPNEHFRVLNSEQCAS